MRDKDIDDLKDNTKELAPGDCNLIKLFIAFVQFRHLKGNSILDNDAFMAITRAEYDAFRINHVPEYHRLAAQNNVATEAATAPPTPSPPMGTITTAPSVGIEREEENDTWHQVVAMQVHTQDVANVLIVTSESDTNTPDDVPDASRNDIDDLIEIVFSVDEESSTIFQESFSEVFTQSTSPYFDADDDHKLATAGDPPFLHLLPIDGE